MIIITAYLGILLLSSFTQTPASILYYPLVFNKMVVDNLRYKSIERQLEKVSNVDIVRLHIDKEDGVISTLLKVKKQGTISFVGLTDDSFRDTSELYVGEIEHLRIESACYKDGVYVGSTSFNIGRSGKAAKFFPFEMRNIQDVIAHYDELVAIIKGRQTPLTQSNLKIIEDGKECYYNLQPTILDYQKG